MRMMDIIIIRLLPLRPNSLSSFPTLFPPQPEPQLLSFLSLETITIMSSILAMAGRRAFARQAAFRAPPRRLYSSKMEEAKLESAARRDPELYV